GDLDINFRMRSVLAASSLEQASRLFPNNWAWQSAIGRLRFRHIANSIERALADRLATPKEALALWRKKAKSLLSTSIQAQSDLSLWLAYAEGLVQTACAVSEYSFLLFTEARKVFTTTLRTYPIPVSSSTNTAITLEEQLDVILPRLRVLHAFVEFELGVHFPLHLARNLSRSECFARALHLIQHAAMGGAFAPLVEGQPTSTPRSALVNTADQLVQRLMRLRRLLPLTTNDISSSFSCVHPVADLTAILSSLLLYLQLLTSGEDNLKPICGLIFSALRDIDNNGDSGSKEAKNMEGGGSSKGAQTVTAGCGSRLFLRLALPAISAVTASCGAYVSKTRSIEYQRSLQGMLPPLILSALESRLTECVRGVCCSVARYLTTTCHHATMRPRTRFEGGKEGDEIGDPSRLLGLPSKHQAELMARLLPSSLDLLIVGLELERWTSIVAGAADNSTANPLSHCWIQGAVPRIRSAFEKALGASSSSSPLLRFGGTNGEMPCLALTMTPSFWTDHLRIILWSAYMAFEWTLAGVSASSTSTLSASDFDAHRKQRSASKAIFYRAVEDLPWAKVLYTDLARYCPEDAEEVVDLLSSKELRLRTFMEEVDLLLTSKLP
ncbi:Nuclear exosome regulator NRDE2, partial [Taenia crassiceps]